MVNQKLSTIVKIFILWYTFIFFSTEILSFFHLMTKTYVLIANLLFFLTVFYLNKKEIKEIVTKIDIKDRFNYIIYSILILTFIQGLMSAPSTTDSMTYHITRIMYWMQEKSVYQDFIRNSHDFMPPFAEYILLHLYYLFNGDRLLFISQWIAYALTIYISGVIAKQLGADKKLSQIIRLLIAGMPIAVLEATSTQVDMVTTALLLICLNIVLILIKNFSIKYATLLGLVLGLGMEIKTPFTLSAIIPLGLMLIPLFKNFKKTFTLGFVIILIAFSLQLRYFSQNIHLYGNPLGQKFAGAGNTYVNERFDIPAIVSNVIRNTMNQIPVPLFTNYAQSFLIWIHNSMGIGISEFSTTYFDLPFKVLSVIYPQEDIAASPIHMILMIVAGVLVFKVKPSNKNKNIFVTIYLSLLIYYLIFAIILKWEPFHPRLQIGFLSIGTIVAVLVLKDYKQSKTLFNFSLFLSIPLAFALLFLNIARPFISYQMFYDKVKGFVTPLSGIPESFFTKPRIMQYFHSRPYWYEPYYQVVSLLAANDNQKPVVFDLMDDEFEYPLWALSEQKGVKLTVLPENKSSSDNLIIATSVKPVEKEGYESKCFKTEVEYGYACFLKKKD